MEKIIDPEIAAQFKCELKQYIIECINEVFRDILQFPEKQCLNEIKPNQSFLNERINSLPKKGVEETRAFGTAINTTGLGYSSGEKATLLDFIKLLKTADETNLIKALTKIPNIGERRARLVESY
jgi:hypothetical protein